MADIITYPENGIQYDAEDASGYLATRLSGVYSAEEDFSVTAQGGLSVQVSAGQAWVRPARFKGRSIIMEQPTTVVLTEADPVRSRIDRLVLRYDAAAKKTTLVVLDGTPDSAGPVAPDISRTALVYDLCLAEIKRPAGSTEVTAADITDTRADETVCGVMRDGVHGIPAATLIQKLRAEIDKVDKGSFYDKTETDALLDALQEQVSKAVVNVGTPIVVWSVYNNSIKSYGGWSTTVPDDVDFIVIRLGGFNDNNPSATVYRGQATTKLIMNFTFSADGTFGVSSPGDTAVIYCVGYHYVTQTDGLKVPVAVGSAYLTAPRFDYSPTSCTVNSKTDYVIIKWKEDGSSSSEAIVRQSCSAIVTLKNSALGTYYFNGTTLYSKNTKTGVAVTFYHYANLDELAAQQTATQSAQADTDAMTVDQEYRIALLELGITDGTT